MAVSEDAIRAVCTEAVFGRGATYRDEGRVRRLDRFGDRVTATVEGTRCYDVAVALDAADFDPRCSCPYDGPGECKHVVAVLLSCADDPPGDDAERVDGVLEDADAAALRAFVRDEFARRPAARERLLARFGVPSGRTVEEHRAAVDRLFDEHADPDGLVRAAVDFSRLVDVAALYRERGEHGAAARIHRALVAGIDDNAPRIDGAYEHYEHVLRSALAVYVDCLSVLGPSSEAWTSGVSWLSELVDTGVDWYRVFYAAALVVLSERE